MDERDAARPECTAGALFVDDEGNVLIVEPTYRKAWEIPGSRIDRRETPREACQRGLEEEFGLELEPGRLLVVDWAPRGYDEHVRYVFDGGALSDEQLDAIELTTGEISSWAYIPPEELFVMADPRLTRRVTAALGARAAGATWYLEHGMPVEAEGAAG